jgi:sugar phosphate isomerase/epimerase
MGGRAFRLGSRPVIPLAYGTYGLPEFSPWESIDWIAATGYSGVELTLADGYQNAGTRLTVEESRKTRERLDATGLSLVGVLAKLEVIARDGRPTTAVRETLRDVISSGMSLAPVSPLVVTFTMGGQSASWPGGSTELVDELGELGSIAAAEGAVLAVEAHVGGLVDRPERLRWLIEQVGLESVRINFDISHFTLPGVRYDIDRLIEELLPLAVHAHVKDSLPVGDGFRFVLPGAGSFDYRHYFDGLLAAGWHRPVTVEVSAMVFTRHDYRPLQAMQDSFNALLDARTEAERDAEAPLGGAQR